MPNINSQPVTKIPNNRNDKCNIQHTIKQNLYFNSTACFDKKREEFDVEIQLVR